MEPAPVIARERVGRTSRELVPDSAGPKRAGIRRVVGLGASIVQGSVSASFTRPLAARLGAQWEVVNAGRNGELAWNALRRVPEVARCAPDDVLVLVGSNDVMASLGPREERMYRRLMRLPERPTLAFYRQSLARIADELRARTSARITLCTLPFLGEVLDSEVNAKVRTYNETIREVATEKRTELVDVYAILAAELARVAGPEPRDFPRGLRVMLQGIVLRRVLGWSFERIARRHGFALLTDGIHLTETAADLVAEALATSLAP